MRRVLAIAALLGAGAALAAERRSGSVIYATAQRLYLDAGAREGLAAGQVVRLKSGTCKVEQVSAHYATCKGSGRPGETFDLPAPPPALVVRRLPAPPPQPVLDQRRAVLASSVFEKVDYHAAGLAPRTQTVEIGIGHTTWAAAGATPWQRERADAWLRGAPIGGGFTLDLDLSARRWSRRSDPISFRPDDPTQLYVWEAALSRRPQSGAVLSLGRVHPWFVPGQVILDGAQAGWRTSGGSEAGIFGGVVPDPVTLAPSLDHGTFGAYWSGQHTGERDSVVRFLRHEVRVAFVNTADLGRRLEAEALLEARITRRLDAGVDVRVGQGDHTSPGYVDAVRVNGAARPLDGLSIVGSFRYEGLSLPELDGPGHLLSGGAARHADLSVAYEPIPQLRITVLSGLSTDLVQSQTRRWIGPEIGALRLFSEWVDVAAGYAQEDGWAPGYSAWMQLMLRPAMSMQVLTRVTWSRTRGFAPVDLDELSGSASIQAQIGRLVALRISAIGRTTLNGQSAPLAPGTGQSAVLDAEIAGQF
jgi:hypothetical protein